MARPTRPPRTTTTSTPSSTGTWPPVPTSGRRSQPLRPSSASPSGASTRSRSPRRPMWIDSHCHVPYQGVGVEVIAEAQAAGITRIITVGTDAEQCRAATETAAAHDGVWATVGLHPHDAKDGLETVTEFL